MNYELLLRITLITAPGILITTLIGYLLSRWLLNEHKRQLENQTRELAKITGDALQIKLAGILAAPHLSPSMGNTEKIKTVADQLPVAREILRTYHQH